MALRLSGPRDRPGTTMESGLPDSREFLEELGRRPVEGPCSIGRGAFQGSSGRRGCRRWRWMPTTRRMTVRMSSSRRCAGEDETARLREAAARHGVSLNNLVQAAWALVLSRYNGIEDVTFGTVRAGSLGRRRVGEEPDPRVGLFVDTVPFRVEVKPGTALGPWLAELRRQQVELRGAEYVSREEMRRAAGLSPREWLFRSVLMFESYEPSERMRGEDTDWVELREKVDIPALAAYAGRCLRLVLSSPGSGRIRWISCGTRWAISGGCCWGWRRRAPT